MKKIALGVEYLGSQYSGWQSQTDLITIQSTIESALSQVANQPIKIICAGRTDKGVHATGQVVHFTTDAERDLIAWVMGTNANLPHDIRIQWAHDVNEEFHARFSALTRRYHYYIYNQPIRSAIWHQRATWHYQPLDAQLMHQGAQYLLGEHDFSAYRGINCQAKSPIRTISEITVKLFNSFILLDVQANAFLHHMVRNIVGVLLPIGEGKQPPEWALEVLNSRQRQFAGTTAKPDGLYLVNVNYPEIFKLPSNKKSLFVFNEG